MSYASTVEPLRAANLLSRRALYDIFHFGLEGDVESSGAASISGVQRVGGRTDLDLLVVVAGGDPFAFQEPALFRWLRQAARAGVRIGGVSGGPVVLARAGLLAGRRLTVHWEHAAGLAERYPDLIIERRLFVVDRDRMTCGGGTAPLDMMHALIAERQGAEFAHLVSDWFLHTDIRNASDPQRGGIADRLGAHSPRVLEALGAMESHVGDPLSLSQLAMIAGVTPRQLNRLFQAAFGESVMMHYRGLRLQTGRRLLQSTSMGIGEIAFATGFANSGHFSTSFRERFGISPRRDRQAGAQRLADTGIAGAGGMAG
ncbi:GlxA family transcriptional regulator [Rhodophyticola sp. MJ-SS7]|nr:GlxA family transcriptional regulator [Rhodophyticola sp. MJ-SS7]